MRETQYSISAFGFPRSLEVMRARLLEEVKELELIDIWSSSDSIDKIADKCADIYIVMVQLMNMIGFDLHAHVDYKMAINRSRKWKLEGDGTGQHIQ